MEQGAEVVLNLQPSSSVTISYHPLFGSHDDIMLLELDEKLLPDTLSQRVVVRGQPDQDAVLCTKSKTYAMKFVGTSNSVLLIPPSDHSEFADSTMDCDQKAQNQIPAASVIKVAPEMKDLSETEEGPFTWDDLGDLVQASDDELRSGLQALSAVEIDTMLKMLLINSLIEGLDTGSVWKLDEKKVCVHFAKQILKGGKKKMESFIEWKKKIPEALPSTPAERFSFLFKEGLKWEWKDLQPYTSEGHNPMQMQNLSLAQDNRIEIVCFRVSLNWPLALDGSTEMLQK
ncbi:hypothetical protein G4B88_021856 [Cannabis sativa]|uniref:Sister chromatid cohesion protein DCC1 n=1 Tax=Cannabis sativa TaxID=3483 RepID=A0A7J6H0M0_CANSA|nr:hypothetical protein G4B88_021856 [Cannabis sativa]